MVRAAEKVNPAVSTAANKGVEPISVALVSTYELGRQPFGLASPAAWLRRAGMQVYTCDLAAQQFDVTAISRVDLIAFYLPMHTATRLAIAALPAIREANPDAALCFYGLYAPPNQVLLRDLGANAIIGGEFEAELVSFAQSLRSPGRHETSESVVSLERLEFIPPDRSGLPSADHYARLVDGSEERLVGYTEASRGCRHLCRHCPVVPVYGGRFRVVQRNIVLDDIAGQVANGARHVTFGDPDFFNGPAHAIAIVTALHERHPEITYDVTIKIEHLLQHERHLATLKETGCLFVTTAVEAIDEPTLVALDKGHTIADFETVVRRCQALDLRLNPTFVAFTPWTTTRSYFDLLETIERLSLVESVAPVQYAIRLLIVGGSRLLELPRIQELVGPFDTDALVHPWKHDDPAVDDIHAEVLEEVERCVENSVPRSRTFDCVRSLATEAAGYGPDRRPTGEAPPPTPVPYLTEPWYC